MNPLMNQDSNWRAPSELQRSRPRAVRMKWDGYFLLFVIVMMFGGGTFLAVKMYLDADRQAKNAAEMEREGVVTEGRVLEVGKRQGKNDSHKVTYAFEANGRTLQGSTSLTRNGAAGLVAGSPIEVTYARSDPSKNWVAHRSRNLTPMWISPFVFCMMWIPAIIMTVLMRRSRRLLENGVPASGVIVKNRWVSNGHGGHRRASYQYRSPDGELRKGGFDRAKRSWVPGTQVTVLYDPENPKVSTLYPPQFYKLDEY